jgi:hypothetical protein
VRRLEDAALRVDERNAVTRELEPGGQVVGIENTARDRSKPIDLVKGRLPKLRVDIPNVLHRLA